MGVEKLLTKNGVPVPSVDFNGVWENELGSQMDVTVVDGAILGKYRTNVGSPKPTEEFDIVGFATADILTFFVNFGKYGSLTAWVGQHRTDEEERIETMWHLVKNTQEEEEEEAAWSAVITGANKFFRK